MLRKNLLVFEQRTDAGFFGNWKRISMAQAGGDIRGLAPMVVDVVD